MILLSGWASPDLLHEFPLIIVEAAFDTSGTNPTAVQLVVCDTLRFHRLPGPASAGGDPPATCSWSLTTVVDEGKIQRMLRLGAHGASLSRYYPVISDPRFRSYVLLLCLRGDNTIPLHDQHHGRVSFGPPVA